jgi:hypothetical protein
VGGACALTDVDRRPPAGRAFRVGRRALREIATIATPDTLLRWHRQLIAGNRHRFSARPLAVLSELHSGK